MLIIRCPFKELFVQIEEKFCNGRLWPYPQPELFYFVARAPLGRVGRVLINRQPNADLDVPPKALLALKGPLLKCNFDTLPSF
jgi:hypothetical protein